MTGRRRNPPPPVPLPSQRPGAAPREVWLAKGTPTTPGVVWLIRPMPDGQWPPQENLPRDDSWSWWVRSACGHPGGVRQWAFYVQSDALTYEQVFRADPCHFTRCAHRTMIENQQRSRG